MFIQILSHTPLWVWGLLAALVALGLSQARERRVRPAGLLGLPLALLMLGLSSMVLRFTAVPVAALIWLAAFGASAAWATRLNPPPGARWLADERRLLLPGSWLPLQVILLVFAIRYAAGAGLALHPQWQASPAAVLPLSLVYGALSGFFAGRALTLWRLTRLTQPTRPARPAPAAGATA